MSFVIKTIAGLTELFALDGTFFPPATFQEEKKENTNI